MEIKWLKSLLLALPLMAAAQGWCADLHGRSSTQLLWFNDFNNGRQTELAEYLRLSVTGIDKAGKTVREITLAIAEGIGQINVESPAELEVISQVASSMGRTMKIALRINPDVDAGTHAKITTGTADSKRRPIQSGRSLRSRAISIRRATRIPATEPSRSQSRSATFPLTISSRPIRRLSSSGSIR